MNGLFRAIVFAALIAHPCGMIACAQSDRQLEATGPEQLAERVLSGTVGVELTGKPGEAVTPADVGATAPQGFRGVAAGYELYVQRPEAAKVQVASGTIIGDGSLVVTAGISPEEGDEIRITLPSGKTVNGKLVARDEAGVLSICRTEQPHAEALSFAEREVRAGQTIMSAQYAGEGDFAVRVGIVSAPERIVQQPLGPWIQIDIPVENGSAGGPLVNKYGELVGIVVATDTTASSASFAVPVREVNRMLSKLNEVEDQNQQRQEVIVVERQRPWLGVILKSGGADDSKPLSIEVQPNSPAANAGLQSGDVLLAINGAEVYTPTQVQRALRQLQPDDQIIVRYRRGDNEADVTVELAAMPKSDTAANDSDQQRGPGEELQFDTWTMQRLENPNFTIVVPQMDNEGLKEWIVRNKLVAPALTVTRSDHDQKLEQLSQQLAEISKQLSALAEQVEALRENQR